MKKALKIILIVLACVVGLGVIGGTVAYFWMGNTANAEEYKLGDDIVKSVKAVVDKREVQSVSSELRDGVRTKTIVYRSASVQEDLITYVQYLRGEGGFKLLKDMDLSKSPASVQLGKESVDPGQIVIMIIDYDSFGYTVTLKKGEGTLTIK